MSKRVIFTCTMLLLLGIAGCWDLVSSFIHGEVHFNLLALFLPVAIALILALPGSRLAANVVFSILYGFLALFLAAPLLGVSMINIRIIDQSLPMQATYAWMLVFVAMFGSVLVLLHWMLFSQPFEDHLSS